ncbi:hypothetical protein SYJ56_05190 [Algoriphagus sp. D3-2-R+10]|uniref:hypothetical protein n=1 Tax=Algoriphagus aurantiacus TaxID=3103948 RepID=UPI002B3A23BB|nr:hypothetical protein [Algoriphagus sp. D3-2-R+10]MEB2774688.1 hypothetical protein [Algoriphagus sp. D3-2-R+10]
MTAEHLSDNDIQLYVLDKINCTDTIIEHVDMCPSCKAKADTYQLLFSVIKQQSKPTFEFEFSGLVLSRLTDQEPANSKATSLFWPIAFIGVCSICVTGYLFGQHLINMFLSVSAISMYLVFTAAITLICFQGIEMINKYKRKINKLDFV